MKAKSIGAIASYTTESNKSTSGKVHRQGEKETMTVVPSTWTRITTGKIDLGTTTIIVPTKTKDKEASRDYTKQLKKQNLKPGYNLRERALLLNSSNGWCFERNLLKMARHHSRTNSLVPTDQWYGWKLWHAWELRMAEKLSYSS